MNRLQIGVDFRNTGNNSGGLSLYVVHISNYTSNSFLGLVNRYDTCILGCTELPIIYEKYAADVTCKKIYDPLKIALEILKEEYDRA